MGNRTHALIWAAASAGCIAAALIGGAAGAPANSSEGATGFGYLWLLFLWPGTVYACMSVAYMCPRPTFGLRLLGKSPRGAIPLPRLVLLAPYHLVVYAVWLVRHLLVLPRLGERPYDKVSESPSLYVGRWPLRYPQEFPMDAKVSPSELDSDELLWTSPSWKAST